MNIFAISGLSVGVTSFLLGFFVLFKSKGNKVNKVWAIFCFFVAIWGFGGYKVSATTTPSQALFWWRMTYIGIIFIPVLFYHFVYLFLKLPKKTLLYLFYFFGFFFLILEWTPWADLFFGLNNISLLFGSLYWVYPPTPLFIFYVLTWFYIVLYGHIELLRAFRNSTGLKRAQLKYFFIGMAVAFLGGGTCYLPCFEVSLYPFLNFTVPLYPIVITYAIIAHRLMDIKLVLRRSFVYLASLSTIIILVIAIEYIINLFLIQVPVLAEVLILISAVSIFPWLRNRYYKFANKYFFSSLYDSQKVIAELSDKLRSILEVDKVCNFISETLINSFHTKAVGILTYNKKKDEYLVQHNKGFEIGKQNKFKNDKGLQNKFAKQNKTLIVEEIKRSAIYKKSKATIDLLTGLDVEMLAPLNIKNKTLGLIALGPKESGDMYNNEDLRVLEVIGAQTAIALQNALLYQESLAFGQKLKQEVSRATKELREANVKLKQLDKAKTEFVSITSHQLRTPITGIKGYLSMLLEGDYGELKKEQAKVMADIFNNTQRLVRLINIFLNVSRIESGRLKLDKTKFDLVDLIEEAIREIKVEASKKELKLEFIKPGYKIEILADRDKLADVILNLIDNAIKYTPQGQVTVGLKQLINKVQVSVKDTGVGIAHSEAKELFTKFVRGKKISQISTSGSGLGLFIAKKIVELHKGKIWVESECKGHGSTFIFEVPLE